MVAYRKILSICAVLTVAGGVAIAQTKPDQHSMAPDHGQRMHGQQMGGGQPPTSPDQMQKMMDQHHGMRSMGAGGATPGVATEPALPGQGAFGAIQEVVRLLDADPDTDWTKVDLEALRQHLIDMNEVTLKADAAPKPIDDGLAIAITGGGRTLVAIRRMIPVYAEMANGHNGWSAKATELPDGELLTVTASDPKEVQHIRGLGFIGLLASGPWHQPHHLAMVKGRFDHQHGTDPR